MITLELLRTPRVGGYAVFDLGVSFLGMYLAAPLLTKLFRKLGLEIPKSTWLYWTLPLSIIVHLLFGTMTLMTKNFLDLNGHYILKLFIIGLTVVGLKGVRRIK